MLGSEPLCSSWFQKPQCDWLFVVRFSGDYDGMVQQPDGSYFAKCLEAGQLRYSLFPVYLLTFLHRTFCFFRPLNFDYQGRKRESFEGLHFFPRVSIPLILSHACFAQVKVLDAPLGWNLIFGQPIAVSIEGQHDMYINDVRTKGCETEQGYCNVAWIIMKHVARKLHDIHWYSTLFRLRLQHVAPTVLCKWCKYLK